MNEPPNDEAALLNAALELPVDERRAYLDKACAGNDALRQQVETLLQAHEHAGGFMEIPPADSDLTRTVRLDKPVTEKPADKIGRYKLLQQIGEGGCGVVFMAEQEEPVRRRVALKILKPGMDTKQVIARFEAERQALALMDHPNIAKVLDAGTTETGRPYFVMELVRGIKITDYCDENNVPTEDRLKLFTLVCQAIQHAHQKGIIHRDIKPSNILVTVNDDVPVPKVIDFGIAKATQGRLTDQTVFTAFEQFIGTPAYMSPEQAVMTSVDIDTRSDIYSLGVLLYELLTGLTPFDQKDLLAAGLDEMRRTIREKEPLRPSTRLNAMAAETLTTTAKHRRTEAPRLLRQVGGDLDWIVMKCLEKERARRYETANGLAADIQRHLDNEPIVARPPSRLYRSQKFVRRNKLAATAAGATIAALMIGLCIASWALVRERAARREAESTRNHKLGALKFLVGIMDPDIRRRQDPAELRAMVDVFSREIGRELGNEPEMEGDLWFALASGCADIGEYSRAVTNALQALHAYRTAFGNEHFKVALALNHLGKFQCANGLSEGITNAMLAVEMARKCGTPELLAVCLLDAAKSLNHSRQSASEAIPLLRETLHLRREVVPNLLAYIDSTRTLVIALEALAHEGKLAEAKAILHEELKFAPSDADLLNLLRTFDGKTSKTNWPVKETRN